MQVRSIILGAIGAIVIIAFFKLVFDSQGRRDAVVGDVELKKALAEHERDEKRASRGADLPSAPTKVRKPKARASAAASAERDGETESAAKPFSKPPPLSVDRPSKDPDSKSSMDEANNLYDGAEYEGAREAALSLLEENPKNVRMTRIVVSSSCIMGDEEIATKHFSDLPPRDQRQMSRRCKRYGIEFDDQDQ
ncbi:MAG: hypothetical protein GY811_21820 [Myxococcales bacterium]|nr:hypothetical protein [Myxococcales bacterium]